MKVIKKMTFNLISFKGLKLIKLNEKNSESMRCF